MMFTKTFFGFPDTGSLSEHRLIFDAAVPGEQPQQHLAEAQKAAERVIGEKEVGDISKEMIRHTDAKVRAAKIKENQAMGKINVIAQRMFDEHLKNVKVNDVVAKEGYSRKFELALNAQLNTKGIPLNVKVSPAGIVTVEVRQEAAPGLSAAAEQVLNSIEKSYPEIGKTMKNALPTLAPQQVRILDDVLTKHSADILELVGILQRIEPIKRDPSVLLDHKKVGDLPKIIAASNIPWQDKTRAGVLLAKVGKTFGESRALHDRQAQAQGPQKEFRTEGERLAHAFMESLKNMQEAAPKDKMGAMLDVAMKGAAIFTSFFVDKTFMKSPAEVARLAQAPNGEPGKPGNAAPEQNAKPAGSLRSKVKADMEKADPKVETVAQYRKQKTDDRTKKEKAFTDIVEQVKKEQGSLATARESLAKAKADKKDTAQLEAEIKGLEEKIKSLEAAQKEAGTQLQTAKDALKSIDDAVAERDRMKKDWTDALGKVRHNIQVRSAQEPDAAARVLAAFDKVSTLATARPGNNAEETLDLKIGSSSLDFSSVAKMILGKDADISLNGLGIDKDGTIVDDIAFGKLLTGLQGKSVNTPFYFEGPSEALKAQIEGFFGKYAEHMDVLSKGTGMVIRIKNSKVIEQSRGYLSEQLPKIGAKAEGADILIDKELNQESLEKLQRIVTNLAISGVLSDVSTKISSEIPMISALPKKDYGPAWKISLTIREGQPGEVMKKIDKVIVGKGMVIDAIPASTNQLELSFVSQSLEKGNIATATNAIIAALKK